MAHRVLWGQIFAPNMNSKYEVRSDCTVSDFLDDLHGTYMRNYWEDKMYSERRYQSAPADVRRNIANRERFAERRAHSRELNRICAAQRQEMNNMGIPAIQQFWHGLYPGVPYPR